MQRPTRRQFVLSASTATLAATAGVFYADPARAVDLQVRELTVDDQTWSGTDAPSELPLRVSGEYRIDANVQPDELRLKPTVAVAGSSMGPHEYPTIAETLGGQEASGQFEFTLNLLALYGLREGFSSTEGESRDYDLTLTLSADVTGPKGDVIGSVEVSDGFSLALTHDAASATVGLRVSAMLVTNN